MAILAQAFCLYGVQQLPVFARMETTRDIVCDAAAGRPMYVLTATTPVEGRDGTEQLLMAKSDEAISSLEAVLSSVELDNDKDIDNLREAIRLCRNIQLSPLTCPTSWGAQCLTILEEIQEAQGARKPVQDIIAVLICRYVHHTDKKHFGKAVIEAYNGKCPNDTYSKVCSSRYQVFERKAVEAARAAARAREQRDIEAARVAAIPEKLPLFLYVWKENCKDDPSPEENLFSTEPIHRDSYVRVPGCDATRDLNKLNEQILIAELLLAKSE